MAPLPDGGPDPQGLGHRILHARLVLPDGGTLLAGDAPTRFPYEGIKGVSITLNYDTRLPRTPHSRRWPRGGR